MNVIRTKKSYIEQNDGQQFPYYLFREFLEFLAAENKLCYFSLPENYFTIKIVLILYKIDSKFGTSTYKLLVQFNNGPEILVFL